MSKLYNKYLELKEKDKNKLYLFKSGKFYIFLDQDAEFINEYLVLKKTPFTKDVYKCGFPVDSLENYMKVFKNHKLNVEIVNEVDSNIVDKIRKIDINNITPLQAMLLIKELKDEVND